MIFSFNLVPSFLIKALLGKHCKTYVTSAPIGYKIKNNYLKVPEL